MRYRLELTDKAQRALRTLPARLSKDVLEIILDLLNDPEPADSNPLGRELQGLHRIRTDGWRIIYQVKSDRVIIVSLKPRTADTYTNLW